MILSRYRVNINPVRIINLYKMILKYDIVYLMKINSIVLENFRNYKQLELDFNPGRNIIVGENAQGKTNLIEAIYLAAFARSFRTNNSGDMVRFGEKTVGLMLK